MKFTGTLTDLSSRAYKENVYWTASVLDDQCDFAERLKTEINVSVTADQAKPLEGKIGQRVTTTLRLFKAVRNGLPEFDGRVVLAAPAAAK
jgi:hypothetical protein